jgi:phosphonate transport system substrate-binding protein
MEREVGVKFTVRVVQSYDDVIESQRRGETHLAAYGAASYAEARSQGVQITPFAAAARAADDTGYFSVFLVGANSPFSSIADLKGKHLGLVDERSTSGNIVPRMELFKLGIIPEQFFSKITYLGSHDLAILGVASGTVDVAVNAWGDTTGQFYENAIRNGAVKRGDLRILFRSARIPNGPMAYLDSLPEGLKASIRRAAFAMPEKAPEALKMAFGPTVSHVLPVDHAAYVPQMELNAFIASLQKK